MTASTERSPGGAEYGSFTSFDVPGATETLVLDINSAGVMVGRYQSAGRTSGFVRNEHGDVTTIEFPGSFFTVAAGINSSGDIVGMYRLASAPAVRHGYLLRDGEFTSFDPPGSTFTNALGINDSGDIVGRFCILATCRRPGFGDYRGFLLRDGEFTIFDFPGANETNAFKINDRGEIVGAYVNALTEQPFLLSEGQFRAVSLPNGKPVSSDNGGINGRGEIVGFYCDGTPPCEFDETGNHGYAFLGGEFQQIDFPGATATQVFGINNRLDIVGSYFDVARKLHGFFWRRTGNHE